MSYDIHFLRREAGQSWADALESLEEASTGGSEGIPPDQIATWERIEGGVRALFPDFEVESGDGFRELSEEATGIQLSQYGEQISLSVPYWYEKDEAGIVIDKIRAIARIVEEETKLTAYDPQLGAPLLNSEVSASKQVFQQVAESIQARGLTTGPATERS